MKHKKALSVILVFTMLISLFASPTGYAAGISLQAPRLAGNNSGAAKDSTPAASPLNNLALKRPVQVSCVEQGTPDNTGDKAVDGTIAADSRWSSGYMKVNEPRGDQWIMIDLGTSQASVTSMKITWYLKVWATKYQIETSSENTPAAWTAAAKSPIKVVSRAPSASKNLVDEFTASDLTSTTLKRYVRLYATEMNDQAAGHAISIQEFEIMSTQPPASSTSADTVLKAVTQLQFDGTHVVLPQVPDGYKIAVVGSDVENVIANDGTILRHTIGERDVPLVIEVKSNNDPRDMARKNITVTAPSQIANYPQEWFPKVNNPNTKPNVIPGIQEWYGYEGYFTLTPRSKIIVNDAAGVNLRKAAQNMQENLREICGFSPEIKDGTAPSAGNIYLESLATDKYDTGKEGYVFVTNKDGVQIYSSTYTGSLYGTVTAEQILWQAENHASIPNGIIRDYPKYEIRGMMLDVARIPHRLQYLKDYEKILQWYKMNEFHLHLNDDFDYNPDTASPAHSEWSKHWTGTHRILSDSFPSLRTVTYPGENFDYYNKIYGEPYYSKQDFRDLTGKGRDAGINVIAEFDTPSHATAYARYALQNPDNLDWLGAGKGIDIGDNNQMLTLDTNSADADKKASAERARRFISQLYDEYLGGNDPVFASDTIHVGADEYWDKKNPEAFRSYSAFLTEIAKKYGKTARMWGAQKMFPGKTEIPKDAVLDVWTTYEEKPLDRMKEGYRVVNVPQPFLYVTPGRWHKDMINEEFVFRTWDPTIFNAGDQTIALKGEPLLLGAKTAMWGDEHKEGMVEADLHERALRAVAMTSEKTWGGTKDNDSYLDYQQKFSRLREGPGTQIAMTIKSESAVVADYDFAKAKTETGKLCIPDQSGNGYDAKVTGGTLVQADGTTYIKFDGSTLMTTPLKTLRYPYTVSFDLKMDSAQQNNKDSSLFSGYDGRLQAVGADGELSLNRSFYTQSFGYKVPEGQKVNITLVGRAGSTRLFVDGKFVKLLSRDDDKDNDTGYFTTFVLPLEEIGKNFTGYIGNIKAYNQAFSSDLVAADGAAVTEVNTALNRNAYTDNVIAPKERDTKKTPVWKAVDGDYDDPGAPMDFRSGWQSTGTADDALIVDLGQPRKISRVFLNWAPDGAASDFNIMVSDDCLKWTLADTVTGNTSTVSNIKLKEPVKARYVKMQGVAFAPENTLKKYYIREMQVYENINKSALKTSIQLAQSAVNSGAGSEKFRNALTRACAALYSPVAPQAEIDAAEQLLRANPNPGPTEPDSSDDSSSEDEKPNQSQTVVTENGITTTTSETRADGTAVTILKKNDTATGSAEYAAEITPSVKSVATENGKAHIQVKIPADISLPSQACAENPTNVTILTPNSLLAEQIAQEAVSAVTLEVTIPSQMLRSETVKIKELTLSNSIINAAKAVGKGIEVTVRDEAGKVAYAWAFSGTAPENAVFPSAQDINLAVALSQAAKHSVIRPVVASNSPEKSDRGLVVNFAHTGLLPTQSTVTLSVGGREGFVPGSAAYLYYYNPMTNALEEPPCNLYTVDEQGCVTLHIAHCSDYVLLPTAAVNPYPIKSDTTEPIGLPAGESYTFRFTAIDGVEPMFTVGNGDVLEESSVKCSGNDYYFTVKSVGKPGAAAGIYCTIPNQPAVRMCVVAVQ